MYMFAVISYIFNIKADMLTMVISIFTIAVILMFLISITVIVVFKEKLAKDSFMKIINLIFKALIITALVLLVTVRYIILSR